MLCGTVWLEVRIKDGKIPSFVLNGAPHNLSTSFQLQSVRCRTPLVPDAQRCFIVQGGFTLLLRDEAEQYINTTRSALQWGVVPALNATKEILDDGRLNQVHPDVKDVSFVSLIIEDNPAENNNTRPENGNEDQHGDAGGLNDDQIRSEPSEEDLQAWPWVLLSVGVVTILVLFGLVRRRRNRENSYQSRDLQPEEDEIDDEDDDMVPGVIYPTQEELGPEEDMSAFQPLTGNPVQAADEDYAMTGPGPATNASLAAGFFNDRGSTVISPPPPDDDDEDDIPVLGTSTTMVKGLLERPPHQAMSSSGMDTDTDDEYRRPFTDESDDDDHRLGGRNQTGAFPSSIV